jgi:hypothetical protein
MQEIISGATEHQVTRLVPNMELEKFLNTKEGINITPQRRD